jgi:hypothetical protein
LKQILAAQKDKEAQDLRTARNALFYFQPIPSKENEEEQITYFMKLAMLGEAASLRHIIDEVNIVKNIKCDKSASYMLVQNNKTTESLKIQEAAMRDGAATSQRETCITFTSSLDSQLNHKHLLTPNFLPVQSEKDKLIMALNLDHRDNCEWNALHHACQHGHLDCVKVLVEEAKISVNSVTSSNNSALHTAAKNGHLEVCKYLVEEAKPIKADVLQKGLENETPMEAAMDHG